MDSFLEDDVIVVSDKQRRRAQRARLATKESREKARRALHRAVKVMGPGTSKQDVDLPAYREGSKTEAKTTQHAPETIARGIRRLVHENDDCWGCMSSAIRQKYGPSRAMSVDEWAGKAIVAATKARYANGRTYLRHL